MKTDQTFLSVAISLLVLGGIFFVIERLPGRARPQPVVRRGFGTDVVYWFATILLTKPLVRLMLILPAGGLILLHVTTADGLRLQEYRGFGPLSRQPLWLQAIQIYLLVDFCAYWTHRLFHRGRWWPFHAVHHSSEDLDWLGSLRVHPVNDLVNKLAQATPVLLLGYNPAVTLSTAPVLTFYAIFIHANLNWDFGPLRSVIATPVFHRWHHSREQAAWDKNFAGLFPFWDILFGTYYMPRDRWPENFGINEPMPAGFLGQLWSPFVGWFRRDRKPSAAGAANKKAAPECRLQ
jgi:sterol desaturase/sphingolipid hydroxylase (fatty acid hydroxylase superfamily)